MNLSDLNRSLPRALALATKRTLLSSTATSTFRASICPAFSAAVTAFSNLQQIDHPFSLSTKPFSIWFIVKLRISELTFPVPSHIGLGQSRDKLRKASQKTLSASMHWQMVPVWARLIRSIQHHQFGGASEGTPLYT